MVIINYSPLVNGIIELILRKGNNVVCNIFIGNEIGVYCLGTIYIKIVINTERTKDEIIKAIVYIIRSLICFFSLEILLYFLTPSYESDHPDEFVIFFCKFRLFSFFAILGIDIIVRIIDFVCCER